MKYKRISEQYPIYLSKKFSVLPNNMVYMVCPSVDSLPSYIGTTTNPFKRYARYIRAMKNPASESHESAHKISEFRRMYRAGESPVMVIIDEIPEGEPQNLREKQWREFYESKGAVLINNTGKMRSHAKVKAQNFTYNLIDQVFDHWLLLVILGLVVIGGMWGLGRLGA